MSPSFAITLLDHIRCPALTRLSLPCARANQSDGEVLQRFTQRSECTITTANLTFNAYKKSLVSPETSLSALSGIIDLKLSFGAEPLKGRFIDCLSDRTVVPNLRVLTITTTTISRTIWEAELKDTLIRVLSARYQSPEESSTGTDIQEVVVVLGRETYMMPGGRTTGSVYYIEGYSSWRSVSEEDKRRLREEYGKDCTIEDFVDADFVEFRKLKERGLDIRLSVWKGRTLIRYV
ncbi:hypothetical protein BDZ89DRAFT_1138951 [Hymenopellis radicata]|nr:hypothetical protein BDZ89DRAFT_1138951 [Hymenopellis radicata]